MIFLIRISLLWALMALSGCFPVSQAGGSSESDNPEIRLAIAPPSGGGFKGGLALYTARQIPLLEPQPFYRQTIKDGSSAVIPFRAIIDALDSLERPLQSGETLEFNLIVSNAELASLETGLFLLRQKQTSPVFFQVSEGDTLKQNNNGVLSMQIQAAPAVKNAGGKLGGGGDSLRLQKVGIPGTPYTAQVAPGGSFSFEELPQGRYAIVGQTPAQELFLSADSLATVADFTGAQWSKTEASALISRNTLSAQEIAGGWKLLFDGLSMAKWRGYREADMPAGWEIEDQAITAAAGVNDIVSREDYGDFELTLDWRIARGGNSGVFFRCNETNPNIYDSGPEMQFLDNADHSDGGIPTRTAGANYDLQAPVADATLPVGNYNRVRILAQGNSVAYWLNGAKVVEYELGGATWLQQKANSVFSGSPDYGTVPRGPIGLQSHSGRVWIRNIKIRTL